MIGKHLWPNNTKLNFQKSIAVLTSGGDCQGMNSFLHGIINRYLIQKQQLSINSSMKNDNTNSTEVYFILNGYQGLVDGIFIKGDTNLTQQNIYDAGTLIGSSRCKEFYQQEGRRKAARNLIKFDVENLIIIGGDGSLTGANLLKNEWQNYIKEFINQGELDQSRIDSKLTIVGIVGSIDNDFWGTDMTIGADSALFRAVECIDALKTTARSHNRAIVVEVMGRNCGYLALNTALATEATYVFIPEAPEDDQWKQNLIMKINFERKNGKYFHIIVMAEGSHIKPRTITDYLNQQQIESRSVVLGHFQRGGLTSAFDHLLSFQMGVEALNVLREKSNDLSIIIVLSQGQITMKPLMECVEMTKKLKTLMSEKNWPKVMELRGLHFINTWENYKNSSTIANDQTPKMYTWAVVHWGPPMPGINAIIHGLVRYGIAQNINVIAFNNGLEGLCTNKIQKFQWNELIGLIDLSGSVIGCQSSSVNQQYQFIHNDNFGQIVENLSKNKVKFLCLIGNYGAFELTRTLYKHRKTYPYLNDMKYCFVPVGMPNDILGIDAMIPWSKLGCDSILNKTMRILFDLIHSHVGIFNQLYLIKIILLENMFYTPAIFGLIVGATMVYPLNGAPTMANLDLKTVTNQASELCTTMTTNRNNCFILIHDTLWSKVVSIYHNQFKSSSIKLNEIDITELQMPIKVSPFDRKLGVKIGFECGKYFSNINFETTPMIINTPFIYEAIPLVRIKSFKKNIESNNNKINNSIKR